MFLNKQSKTKEIIAIHCVAKQYRFAPALQKATRLHLEITLPEIDQHYKILDLPTKKKKEYLASCSCINSDWNCCLFARMISSACRRPLRAKRRKIKFGPHMSWLIANARNIDTLLRLHELDGFSQQV